MKSYKDLEVYQMSFEKDFIHFLVQSHGSLLETISHLEMIRELYHETDLNNLINRYESLGGKIFNFIEYVDLHWKP